MMCDILNSLLAKDATDGVDEYKCHVDEVTHSLERSNPKSTDYIMCSHSAVTYSLSLT
jgi:hypothetical protein